MRTKIFNLNQEALVKHGIGLEESLLLDYILTFKRSGKMKKIWNEELSNIGYWVDYNSIIADIPILFTQVGKYATEEEICKNVKANKAKIARMFKKLSFMLETEKRIKQGKGGVGSEIYVYMDKEIVKELEDGIEVVNEVEECENAENDVAESLSGNISIRIMAINQLRDSGFIFANYNEDEQENAIKNKMEEIFFKGV